MTEVLEQKSAKEIKPVVFLAGLVGWRRGGCSCGNGGDNDRVVDDGYIAVNSSQRPSHSLEPPPAVHHTAQLY